MAGAAKMNIFRFLGDLSHIVSFVLLLHKIIKGKSSAGISLRTQELYAGARRARDEPRPRALASTSCLSPAMLSAGTMAAARSRASAAWHQRSCSEPPAPPPPLLCAVVFCTRYIDLLWNFSSMYNWVLKICFISASVGIVYMMRFGAPQKATYNAENDSFPIQYLIAPCAVLGLIINQDHYSPFEIVWAFSVYLEAVAILPQLFLLQKLGEVPATAPAATPAHPTPAAAVAPRSPPPGPAPLRWRI